MSKSKEGASPQSREAQSKEHDAKHIVAFASKNPAQPCGKRKNHGIRHQIAGQDPGAFVVADGETSGDMRQGNIGNGGVEQLHKGGQRNRDRDDPRIYCGPFGPRPGERKGGGYSTHTHVSLNASFDATRDRSVPSNVVV